MEFLDDYFFEVYRLFVVVLKVIVEINIDYVFYKELCSVLCMNDEEIWMCGNNNKMKFYNF